MQPAHGVRMEGRTDYCTSQVRYLDMEGRAPVPMTRPMHGPDAAQEALQKKL